MRQLLAIDLDGTLINRHGSVSPSDRRAIDHLRERDVVVTIATGRTPAATLHVARDLELEGPCVCTDGAVLIDMASGDEVLHRPLGAEASLVVREALRPFPRMATTLLVGSTAVLDEQAGMLQRVAESWSPVLERVEKVLDHPSWSAPEGVTAAAVVGLTENVESIHGHIESAAISITRFEVKRWPGISSLIIHADGVSKGDGVRRIAAMHDVSIENTFAVGDWLNDLSMLRTAGHSFAMNHAPPEVVDVADHHLTSSRNGGAIAEIAERFFGLASR